MPNRILREGILTSERINKLGTNAELFYRRLMSVVDDYGRFDARPAILRTACYPLRVDVVREADISRHLAEVQKAGLIALYSHNGKGYLQVIDWRQQVRAKASKWPDPPRTCVADAKHVLADAKHMHTKSESETESKTKTECSGNTPKRVKPRPKATQPPAAAPTAPPEIASQTAKGVTVNHPPLDAVISHFEACSDYGADEVRLAYSAFQASTDADGNWWWGKRLVTDWRAAMESRLGDARARNPNANTSRKADRLLRDIESA